MDNINKALEYIKSKHNGEIPYTYGRRECAKLMSEYAEEFHQSKTKSLNTDSVNEKLPHDNDKSWNTYDVITKLTEAANILLYDRNYDGHGWEEIEMCCKRGKEICDGLKQSIL